MENEIPSTQEICSHNEPENWDYTLQSANQEHLHGEDHKAFYYAIRSNNVNLLDALISKWKSKKCSHDFKQLGDSLAEAYEELNLKNVKLSESMRVHVESKLVDLSLFCNSSVKKDHSQIPLDMQVKKRIDLVSSAIEDLFVLSDTQKVDIRFLFICKFIAKNARILKRQVPFTYKTLPWEEIEFCLVSFLSSHTKTREINFVFKTLVDKQQLLEHLKIFSNELTQVREQLSEKCLSENLNKLPEESRADIAKRNSNFKDLYDDYEKMRDIYSLKQMEHHINLVLADDIDEEIKYLVIERALQVIGEHLKNTLTSPNLSTALCETIINSVSQSTNKILKDLRDSLSHFHSLRNRLELEKDQGSDFLSNVMNDLRKIGVLISDIFYEYKMSMVQRLLKKLSESSTIEEMRDVIDVFESIELDQTSIESINIKEHKHAEDMVEELEKHVKTDLENDLISKINDILRSEKKRLARVSHQCVQYLSNFFQWKTSIDWQNSTNGDTRIIKTLAKNVLKEIELGGERQEFQNILSFAMDIANSFQGRLKQSDIGKVEEKMHRFFYAVQFEIGNVKWIEDLKKKLEKSDIATDEEKQAKLRGMVEEALDTLKEEMNLPETYNTLVDELRNKMVEEFNHKNQFDYAKTKLMQLFDKLADEVSRIREQCSSKKEVKENLVLVKEENKPVFYDLLDLLMKVKRKKGKEVKDMLRKHFDYYDFDNGKRKLEKVEHEYSILLNSINRVDHASQEFQKIVNLLNIYGECKKRLLEIFKTKMNDQPKEKIRDDNHLEVRLSTLKRILNISEFTEDLVKTLVKNEKLQAAVKLIVLDIIEVLKDKNSLNDNRYFLDHDSPVLIGNQMRNYLAHGDSLIDVLDCDPLVAVVSHAKEIIQKYSLLETDVKIGKSSVIDLIEVENHYVRGLDAVTNQLAMFSEAQTGNIEDVKECLQKGADVNGRDVKSCNALHYAARGDNLETMHFFLDQNLSLDEENAEGEKPLHIAAGTEGRTVVFFVSNKHIDVNLYNNEKKTLLHYAARDGCVRVVQVLLDHQAKVDAVTNKGWTPLHLAAQNGHLAVAASLIDNGALVDCKTNIQSLTALHIAALHGHSEVTRYLIAEKNSDFNMPDEDGMRPLHLAAVNNHFDIVNALLNVGAHVNAQSNNGWTPLHLATQNGYLDIVNVLLQHKASIHLKTFQGATPLLVAAQNGCLDILISLINMGADVNSACENRLVPLHLAAENGYEDIVDVLLRVDGIDVNAKDLYACTPLHFAADRGNKKIVESLLSNSADIHAVTNKNFTPLYYSAKAGHTEIVNSLILRGANVNAGASENNATPLYIATQNGHLSTVSILLKNGAKVDTRVKPQYATSLHIAALNGFLKILNLLLLESDFNIDSPTAQGWTLLHAAAQRGQVGIIAALLKRGAMVDAETNKGWTPLHIAVQNGHLDVVNALLKANTRVGSKSSDKGATPLYYAALNGHLAIMEVLLENNAKITEPALDGSTILHVAALYGHLDMVKHLVAKKKANFNATNMDGWTPLWTAALNGHLLTFKYLMELKPDISGTDKNGWTLLHVAALRNHLVILTSLLDKGVNIDVKTKKEGGTPLHIASRCGHVNIVRALVERRAKVAAEDIQNWTPLHAAAEKGHLEVIEMLLSGDDANVNAQTNLGMTALHIAAQNGHLGVVLCLIDSGAFIDPLTRDKCTPLIVATHNRHINVVNALLRNGADVNVHSAEGWTALHIVAGNGQVNILKTILEEGADVTRCNDNGWTALHIAALNGNVDVFKVLLDNGANFLIRTYQGYSPLYLAAHNHHDSIVKALLEKGANIIAGYKETFTPLHVAILHIFRCSYDKETQGIPCDKDLSASNNNGIPLLHLAARSGNSEVVKYLLAKGLDVLTTHENHTVLYEAVMGNDESTIRFILENLKSLFKDNPQQLSQYVNAPDNDGDTPLMLAIQEGNMVIIEMLMDNESNIHAKNKNGATALTWAINSKNREVAEYLLQKLNDVRNRDRRRSKERKEKYG